MPFEVNLMKDQADSELQDVWVADRRLWLTADKSKAVEDGDPRSAFLLIAPGQTMLRTRAEELGVIPDPVVKEAEQKTESDVAPKEKSKPADKEKKKPADKSRRKQKTK
jgi:hypothetical protein